MADAWADAAREHAAGNTDYITPTIPYAMGMMSTAPVTGQGVMDREALAQLHKTDAYAAMYYQTYTEGIVN